MTEADQTTTYGYDGLGRLSQTSLPTGVCRNYGYDADSNRTQTAESATGCGGTFTTTATYHYTPATTAGVDQLTSVSASGTTNYAYTTDGQVNSYGSNTLTWDGWQRVSGGSFNGTTVTYKYDPSGGLRVRTSSSGASTRYLLGDLFEADASGHITTAYVDGPNGDLAQYSGPPSAGATITYLYYNAHGDLAAEADGSGTRTALHTYDPFGAPLDTQPADQTAHRYTGAWAKQYDTASDLVLMGARPYDPSLGRFLAVDPIDGGSLNNYDYAGQDPINRYDLAGTMSVEQESGGGLGYGWLTSTTTKGNVTIKTTVVVTMTSPTSYALWNERKFTAHTNHGDVSSTYDEVAYYGRPTPSHSGGSVPWREVDEKGLDCVAGGIVGSSSAPPGPWSPWLAAFGCLAGMVVPSGSTGPQGPPP